MPQSTLVEFRDFMLKTNALALAIGVVIGGAVSKLVGALVQGVLMPLIGVALPGGGWRELRLPLDGRGNTLALGELFGATIDFLIIAAVVFLVSKKLLGMAPPTK